MEVGQEDAVVDLTLTTEYGKSIPRLADAVTNNVIDRVESLTGLGVTEAKITVAGIFFPQEEQSQQQNED